jgi:glutathione S-transferase
LKENAVLRLLGRKTSGNVQKVLFYLEETATPYTREDYGRQFNNTQTPEYLELNPNAKVPTLIDGDLVVWESNTILRYLAARAASPLYPADPAARTHVERWMDWQLATLNPAYVALFQGSKLAPAERAPDFGAQVKAMGEALSILDRRLGKSPWLAGASTSLAEMCLAPIVYRCLRFPVELPATPNLKRWDETLSAREAFKRATAA